MIALNRRNAIVATDALAIAESHLTVLDAGCVSPATALGQNWVVAKGKDEVIQMFSGVCGTLKAIKNHNDGSIWCMNGSDRSAVEGTSGKHRDGPWFADQPKWGAGWFCDCTTPKDSKFTHLYTYLDPDHAGRDTARYGWITA